MKGKATLAGVQPGTYNATVREGQLFSGKPYKDAPQFDEQGEEIRVGIFRVKMELDDKQITYYLMPFDVDKSDDTFTIGSGSKTGKFIKACYPKFNQDSEFDITDTPPGFDTPTALLEAPDIKELSEEGFRPITCKLVVDKHKIIGSRVIITVETKNDKNNIVLVTSVPK